MKKILYTIGIMMFMAAAVKPLYALGAEAFSGNEEDVPFSTASISSKLVKAIGLNPAANWGEIFGEKDDEDVGQDLYAVIYEKTQSAPDKQAFKNIAGRYGVPETDMVKIVYGDYGKIIEKKPTLTQAEAYNKVAEIQQALAEEKDILRLQADIKAAVEPNEIFANDDLDDSGFDLINDLQIIENLLFLKSQPISVGGTFTPSEEEEAPAEGGAAGGAGQPAGGGNGAGAGGISGAGAGAGTGPSAAETGAAAAGLSEGSTAGQAGITSAETAAGALGTEGKLNPNTCFEDNNFEKALDEFEEKKATDKNLKDGSSAQTGAGEVAAETAPQAGAAAPMSGTAAGSSAAGGPGKQQPTTDFMNPIPKAAAPAVAAPADNWLQPKECDTVFCLFVEFISAPVTSTYQDIDNCIACHAEKINDQLKETISHSLVPAKAPGNLGESAKCKKAMLGGFESINMNIYATPIPVQTPANDDLVYGKNIEDEWYDFCNAMSFPFSCRKEEAPKTPDESSYGIPPSLEDIVAKKELTNSSEETTMAEVARKMEVAAQKFADERIKSLQIYDVSLKADQSVGFMDPLKVELDQMNFYFANIRDILHSLHEAVDSIPGGQACTDIRDKKECE